jgi:hypothetical protein
VAGAFSLGVSVGSLITKAANFAKVPEVLPTLMDPMQKSRVLAKR